MRLLLRSLVVVLVSATIAAASAAGEPGAGAKRMVLQLSDLPHGFGVDRGSYVSNAELARQNTHKDYEKLGRLTGYDVLYTKLGVRGLLGVDSFASIYKTGAGAHDSLMQSMRGAKATTPDAYRDLAPRAVLGSETRFYVVRAKQDGAKVELYTVAWRDGPVFAEVMGGGIAGTVDPAQVLALAKKQARRIDEMLR
jgi:hypothetical protein